MEARPIAEKVAGWGVRRPLISTTPISDASHTPSGHIERALSGTIMRFFVPIQLHTDSISAWIRSLAMHKAFGKRHRLGMRFGLAYLLLYACFLFIVVHVRVYESCDRTLWDGPDGDDDDQVGNEGKRPAATSKSESFCNPFSNKHTLEASLVRHWV